MKLTKDDYAIYNILEEVVEQAVGEVLSEDNSACKCPYCRDDIKCFVLNRLKPQYEPVISTIPEKRPIHLDRLESSLFHRIMIESYKALAKVKAQHRHDVNRSSLHNTTEDLALLAFRDIYKQEKLSLGREELSQVMATTLNGLTAQYSTTVKGDVFSRTLEVDPSYLAKLYSSIYNALKELPVNSLS